LQKLHQQELDNKLKLSVEEIVNQPNFEKEDTYLRVNNQQIIA